MTDEGATKIAEEGRYLAEDGPLPDYATALVRGVEAHRVAIDKHLAATSENWAICSSAILEGMSCETISRSTAGSRARMLRLAG
ncbi:MAG: hypothetical protein ACLS73_03160 [Bilophila wadsworthia]